jgi:hypothetical protein
VKDLLVNTQVLRVRKLAAERYSVEALSRLLAT